MNVASKIMTGYTESIGVKRKLWGLARRILIRVLHDPECQITIHGWKLFLPLSHELPRYLSEFPVYDRLPTRISSFVHDRRGCFNCIDVGANIGDSIAAFHQNEDDRFLAIEPNPGFLKHLKKNWGWNEGVIVIETVCSSSEGEGSFTINERSGTASIDFQTKGEQMAKATLDQIAIQNSFDSGVQVLKIDTDGHDFEVIKGAKRLIQEHAPIVLFECDSFKNERYIQDCLDTLCLFHESGYEFFLLYDNFGYLMGRYSLSDLASFKQLLFYQLTSEFYYFDILLMQSEDLTNFYFGELDYFSSLHAKKAMKGPIDTICNLLRA